MDREIKPGIYMLSNKEYHSSEYHALSKGGIDRMLTSPAHFRQQLLIRNPPTPEMVFGGAFHTITLEPHLEEALVVVKKSAPKGERDKLAEDGKYLIAEDSRNDIEGMVESIKKSETANNLIFHPEAVYEESFFWLDPTYGFLCKCRPDVRIRPLGVLVDLKSTKDASAKDFAKSCAYYHYDSQSGWYLNGANETLKDEGVFYRDFIFVAVEKTPPYGVGVYRATQEMLDNGRTKIRSVLPVYAECLKTDQWPAYEDAVQDIYLPGWAMVA